LKTRLRGMSESVKAEFPDQLCVPERKGLASEELHPSEKGGERAYFSGGSPRRTPDQRRKREKNELAQGNQARFNVLREKKKVTDLGPKKCQSVLGTEVRGGGREQVLWKENLITFVRGQKKRLACNRGKQLCILLSQRKKIERTIKGRESEASVQKGRGRLFDRIYPQPHPE